MNRPRHRFIFVFVVIAAASISLFQNCTYSRFDITSGAQIQGGTGADGKVYVNYDDSCSGGKTVIANAVAVANDSKSAKLIRKNCQNLASPVPVQISDLHFGINDSTVFQMAEQIFDLQLATGGQRVTLNFCESIGVIPAAQSFVWQTVGNSNLFFGSVTIVDGSSTGVMNLIPPSVVPPQYKTQPGQASQMDLVLNGSGGASLKYSIGSGGQVSIPNMNCASQTPPATPNDGSVSAPLGPAQKPALLNGYPVRPTWKVAGVDYAVGFSVGTVLKNPLTDPSITANPKITIDSVNRDIRIHGDDVTLDSYDFTLNGGYSVNVQSGSNTVIKNSNVGMVLSATASTNLTVSNCVLDGGGASGTGWALIAHAGAGTLTVTYNWMRNYPAKAVESVTGGNIVMKYNLLENGGMKPGNSLTYLFLSNGPFPSVQVAFNTTYQPVHPGGSEGFKFYYNTGALNGEISYNTMLAIPTGTQNSMSHQIHVGGGTMYPAQITATIHDNYMDSSGAYEPFYPGVNNDGNTTAVYSNNSDLLTGQLLTTDP